MLVVGGTSALAACGDATTVQPSWVAGHPNTATVAFDTTAPGLCAITVRYPDEAPAAINYLGTLYVQVTRGPHSTHAPADRVIDHSGDWQIDRRNGGELVLLTPSNSYGYRPETTC